MVDYISLPQHEAPSAVGVHAQNGLPPNDRIAILILRMGSHLSQVANEP